MAFYVGQKVVCVDVFRDRGLGDALPVLNQVYTVRGIDSVGAESGLLLVEIVNIPHYSLEGLAETCFFAPAFKPLVEKKTDISIFTKMLTPTQVNA